MEYNKSPISVREGKVFIDGLEAFDSVAFTAKVTPEVWTGKQLGERTPSSRYLGYAVTGSITRRRSTPWLKDIIKKYKETGVTPEFTIQGVMDDKGSDYFAKHGSDTVTCVGCVLTGDINLIQLDTNGDVLDDVISFNAKDIV